MTVESMFTRSKLGEFRKLILAILAYDAKTTITRDVAHFLGKNFYRKKNVVSGQRRRPVAESCKRTLLPYNRLPNMEKGACSNDLSG